MLLTSHACCTKRATCSEKGAVFMVSENEDYAMDSIVALIKAVQRAVVWRGSEAK